MPFVEVFVPAGTLSSDQRTMLHQRLVEEVMVAEGAPDTPAARAISWLVLHEVEHWSVGGEPTGRQSPPLFMVRVAVPAGSLDDTGRAEMMRRVNEVLVAVDGDERLRAVPEAWVHINEIPDGNWGAMGRVMRLSDIAAHVTGASA